MADIKVKKKSDIKIKTFDKSKNYAKNLKNNIVNIKEKERSLESNEENFPIEYSANQITNKSQMLSRKGTEILNKYGEKSTIKTTANIKKTSQYIKTKIKTINKKQTYKLKKAQRKIKNTPKQIKSSIKMTKNTLKTSVKGAKKAYQITKMTIKNIKNGIKTTIKLTTKTIKAIIAGTKALISLLLAGGWIAVTIIVIICLIGLICSSTFGIFFSNEIKSADGKNMSSVISEINIEFVNKITEIQNSVNYDDYEINSDRAEWKDIISVYTVLMTEGKEQSDVITLDDNKIEKLRSVFWEMNTISSRVENIEKEIETTDENGIAKIEKVNRKVLYIDITSKTVEEMINIYQFSEKQKEQLAEIRKEEYNQLWSNVLYGSSSGSTDIVQVASSQIGNIGGQPYWSWYGYNSRVSWCACFVSWCADQCGYIEKGIIPKFANCQNEGIGWFKTCGLWQKAGYIPKARRYYIF